MSFTLRDRPWRISYSSNENNPIADFYIPALECAVQYDRRSGFFNSAVLSKVARGLGAMLHQNGRMRLVLGCQFAPQDLQAIQQGYKLREVLAFRLDAELKPPENFAQLKHFEILSWLVQHGYLDIKIAVPLKSDGSPQAQLDSRHLFHEKVGIFTNQRGDRLAFSGSNNETLAGWEQNVESFHVYCSWDGGKDLERVQEEQFRFEQLWNHVAPNVQVFDVPEAIQQKLLRYAPAAKPQWSRQAEFDTRPLSQSEQTLVESEKNEPLSLGPLTEADKQREREAFHPLLELHCHPGCLDFCLKSIPIQPWPHQLKILRRIAQQFPCNYLIADEVGLGKTVETGLVLRYLLVSQKVKRVLVLAPASVQPQWQEELREKFNLHFWSYSQGVLSDPYGQKFAPAGNPWNTKNLVLASSHLIRRADRVGQLLEAEPWDLVVLDEAHHARRRSPQQREETPNGLLAAMRQLKERTRSLLLLSATPMQIDPIEIFDLLHLLGLKGLWSYGDNFCHYFASLGEPPHRQTLEFWQQMAGDYFKQGGRPCPRFEKLLAKSDRRLLYQLSDTWQKGRRLLNPKQTLADERFIQLSRQFLTVNAPLKDLMFRHTRNTLRQYYRRGILERDVPRREVYDNAIVLEPKREMPLYQAVSNYVRNFYNLAQQDNRKGLGFLMTLYRKRLTSSFYAVRESLRRRLDGISITADDWEDLEEADDDVIQGLESYLKPVDPQEIEVLEYLLRQFENTGEDSKLSHFLSILRQELIARESAIVFTQYTDTLDYLRETLVTLYGAQVACYSGRGGERYQNKEWRVVPKEQIKRQFREGQVKLLLCTESASEGLNLQTCGVLVNYDLPWNPMRVEQRIGRLDRIGQIYPTVRIHNFYYDGTVEARVYRRLRDRINAFQTVVGNLQPILARVPTFIEQAVMSADPQEEGVLLSHFEQVLELPPLRPALDEMVAMDVEADLAEIRQPLPLASVTPAATERLLTSSLILKADGVEFEQIENQSWKVSFRDKTYSVTFYPEQFDKNPSLRLMSFGEPLFEELIQITTSSLNSHSTIYAD